MEDSKHEYSLGNYNAHQNSKAELLLSSDQESKYQDLLRASYSLICNSTLKPELQDETPDESQPALNLLQVIINEANKGDTNYIDDLVYTLNDLSDSETAIRIIRYFKKALSTEELNGDLLAKILGLSVGQDKSPVRQHDLKLDLDNLNTTAVTCIKELINISVLNDESAKKFAARTTEPSFTKVRCGVAHDVMVQTFMTPPSFLSTDVKKGMRPEILPFFKECAWEYLETTRKNSHPGNVMVIPATYTNSSIQLVINLIKLNGHSKKYLKGSKRRISLHSTDGKKIEIEIPDIVIGSVWNFFDLVTLSSFIEGSQQKFRSKVLVEDFKKEKENVEKEMILRLFSFEKIQESLSNLIYNTSFLTQFMLSMRLKSLKKDLKEVFYIDAEADYTSLKKNILQLFKSKDIDFNKIETMDLEEFNKIHPEIEKIINEFLRKRLNWYFRKLDKNEIAQSMQKALLTLKITTNDIFAVLHYLKSNNIEEIGEGIGKFVREKYGLLYEQSEAKRKIDNEFNRILVSDSESFLKPYTELRDDELEFKNALLKALYSLNGDNPPQDDLKKFKNALDSVMMEYEANVVATTMRSKLGDKEFNNLITSLSQCMEQGLNDKQIGKLVYAIFQNLGFNELFNRSYLQKFCTNTVGALLWLVPGKVGEKARTSPDFKPHELPRQIEGLANMPSVNLWYSLRQIFEAVKVLSGNLRETIIHPLNHERHKFYYAVKDFFSNKPGKIIEKNLCKYFEVSASDWSSLYGNFRNLLNSNDVINRFDDVFKNSFKKYCSEIAHLSPMYNSYQSFITLILFNLYYPQFTKELAAEIIDNSDTYLKAVLESATLSAAAYLRSPAYEKQEYKSQQSDSVYIRCLNMISALGTKDKLFPKQENMPDSYYEALVKVLDGMLSTFKFDPEDKRYQFLVKHCAVRNKKQEVEEVLAIESNQKADNSRLSSPAFDNIISMLKNIFLTSKKIPADKVLPLGLTLGIFTNDLKLVKSLIANYCKSEKRLPVTDIVEVLNKHKQTSINCEELWKAIDTRDLPGIQKILKNAQPFALSIAAVRESKQEETNPILYAYKKVSQTLSLLEDTEDEKKKRKYTKKLKAERKIVRELIKYCSDHDELITILLSLFNPTILEDPEMKDLLDDATDEMRKAISNETPLKKLVAKIFGKKKQGAETSTGSNTESVEKENNGSSANSPNAETKKDVNNVKSAKSSPPPQAQNLSLRGFFNRAGSKSSLDVPETIKPSESKAEIESKEEIKNEMVNSNSMQF